MRTSKTRAVSETEQKHLQSLRHHSPIQDQSYEPAKNLTEKRVDGTCKWLLVDEQYQAWLRTDSGLLVISADPGCGKSVLARYLIEEGLPRGNLTIFYFFFKDNGQDRVHLALCALLHQLLVSKPFLNTDYLAQEHSRDGESLKTNVSKLWNILVGALQDTRTGRVAIVVDGLDECKPGELGIFSGNVKSLFSDKDSAQQIRFIVTTRPYRHIISLFDAPHIRIAGELESGTIKEEVRPVIQHRLETLKKMPPETIPIRHGLLPTLKKDLLSVDHPTYLWVALIFKFIESGKFHKTTLGLEAAIKGLPRNINLAYEKILNKTDSDEEDIIRKALTLVLGAKRPMSIDEMNVALNIARNLAPAMTSLAKLDLEDKEVFMTSLRNWTGLFITIYNDDVYFLHQTVRGFLAGDASDSASETPRSNRWQGTFSTCEANKLLAGIFLRCIPMYCDRPNRDLASTEFTPAARMYKFAVEYIEVHLTNDIGNGLLELATHVLARFGRDWTYPLEDPPKSWTDRDRALLLAAWNGLTAVVVYLVSLPGIRLECCDGRGRTSLVLALLRGTLGFDRILTSVQSTIASGLLDAGANPNPEMDRNQMHPSSPLHICKTLL